MKKFIVFLLFIVISSAQIVKCQTQDSLKYGSLQSRWNKMLTLENPWFNVKPNEYDHGTNKWDLVALIYADIAFGGSITRGGFIDTVANSLKQGGLVVYECMHQDFFSDEAKEKGWGDTIENIVDAFDSHGFEIISIISSKQESDWSTKPTRTICISARKK